MLTQPVHSLAEVPRLPASQVGTWAMLLGKLAQQKTATTGGFVVPITTLSHIARSNRLEEKLAKLDLSTSSVTKLKLKVLSIFQKISIDQEIGHAWLKSFYHQVGDQPALITASWTKHAVTTTIQQSGIKGDANVLETMLEVWAEAYLHQFSAGLTPPSLHPASLVVQAQPKPQVYGWVDTQLPQPHYKAVVLVTVSRNPLPNPIQDTYKVDVRTWHIIEHQLHQANKPILDDQQVILAAQAGYQTKLLQFEHGRLDWTMSHDHLTPVAYHTEYHLQNRATQARPTTSQAQLTGTSVIPGIVTGTVFLAGRALPSVIPANSIIVSKTLTSIPPHVLRQISGVITESPLSSPILTQLQTYHIPTVIKVAQATQILKLNQAITLDAVAGKIRPQSPPSSPTHTLLTTKLLIETQHGLTDQLAQLHPTEVLFKPEYSLLQYGTHPLHFIRSRQREELYQLLSQKLQSFRSIKHVIYAASNLTSADLAGLKYGGQFEAGERNPDLGYRGALRSISQTELFDFELEVLAHVHRISHQKLTILLTGVRSPGEYKLLAQHIRAKLPESNWLSIWLEVSTPENAINHFAYQHLAPQGIVVNLPRLHALAHGIDPHNQDVYRLYPWNVKLLKHLLQHVIQEARHVPCYSVCPTDQPALLEASMELGVAGVIVKPYYFSRAKELLTYANDSGRLR